MEKNNAKVYHGPEFLRKILVSLKRRPQIIPQLVLIAAFLVYSMNLTYISNTTAKIQGQGMGLCGFATMLFSILSLVCFGNAFPYRKKPHIPMLVLMFVMIGIVLYCDIKYSGLIVTALTRAENPITITKSTAYIAYAYNVLQDHMMVLGAAVVLILLEPVYGKLIRKINTNVEVEDNGNLAAIELDGDDDAEKRRSGGKREKSES